MTSMHIQFLSNTSMIHNLQSRSQHPIAIFKWVMLGSWGILRGPVARICILEGCSVSSLMNLTLSHLHPLSPPQWLYFQVMSFSQALQSTRSPNSCHQNILVFVFFHSNRGVLSAKTQKCFCQITNKYMSYNLSSVFISSFLFAWAGMNYITRADAGKLQCRP